MIYRSLKQGYKYELEVNVVIFSSFLGFFLFLLFREFFPQGGSNSSPEFLRSPVKTILNRSQGHRCRHRDPSISPEMLRSQVVSLQHRDPSRIQKLYFASLGILNFQIPLYLTVYSILTKKQCGRPTGNLLKEADQEVHTTR